MSIRNFDALFAPKTIALIGASNEPGSVGAVLGTNLFGSGFAGTIMPVNPHELAIQGVPAYASVSDLPTTPDLAVIATPAPLVPQLISALGGRGCRGAVVISAGFGAGSALRQALLDAARPHLMRVVGPNCLGIMAPAIGLNATFAANMPRAGSLALVSQSGAIVAAMLDWADQKDIGFSHVVSLGDMADADFGDMLDYLAMDQSTQAILMYAESITHARKFMSAARIAARAKPVVVVKAGRSAAGAKAAFSHTGALGGTEAVYDAAFRRAGLLRVDDMDQLFEAALLLARGARVRGDRLVVLTNGGGAGVMAADALERAGGRLAPLSEQTIRTLDEQLPAAWSRGNPIDVLGDAQPVRYEAALKALEREQKADAVLVINCPTAIADGTETARSVAAWAGRRPRLPILACWLGGTIAARGRAALGAAGLPSFESPEAAVRAFMHLDCYRRNQVQLLETPGSAGSVSPANLDRARELIRAVLADGRTALTAPEANEIAALFGIAVVPISVAQTPEEAAKLAADLGFPVVVKILSPDISHKSDVGGVALGLSGATAVQAAAEAMEARARARYPEARLQGFMIQPMVERPQARELIVGAATDACFGPFVLFGQGGTAAEVVADRAVGLPPLNDRLAGDMIEQTRVARLLEAYRNVAGADIGLVKTVLVRVSDMISRLPEIAELDINPLLADSQGVLALDCRIGLQPAARQQTAILPYPYELERHVVLQSGRECLFRPIRPEDEPALRDMIAACTPNDLRLRFFNATKGLSHKMTARLSQIDYDREMAFVAVEPGAGYGQGPIFGVARIISDSENFAAEFAVTVRSDMQKVGLGYALMEAIIAHGRARGLSRIHGEILSENEPMLGMARELGFRMVTEGATVRATLILS